MKRVIVVAGIVAALTSLFGCQAGSGREETIAIGQQALTQLASEIRDAEVTRAEFLLSGPVQEPKIVLDLAARTADPEQAKEVLIAGQKAVIGVADRIGKQEALASVFVTDAEGRVYKGKSVGFDDDNPLVSELRKRYR